MKHNRRQIHAVPGQGGFGSVYKGWADNMQRLCVVKKTLQKRYTYSMMDTTLTKRIICKAEELTGTPVVHSFNAPPPNLNFFQTAQLQRGLF